VLAVALETSLHENAELAKNYQELLTAVTSNKDTSELVRGIAGDLQRAFEERALFGLAFLKAEIQVVGGDQHRRAQVCDLRDLLEEKNDDLAKVNEQLREAEEKVSSHVFLLGVKDDEINNTVPALNDRTVEVEQIMDLQAISSSEYQSHVIADLKLRLERQTQIAEWYQHEFLKVVNQMEGLQAEWDFYYGGTEHELHLAQNFRDQRDVLKVECLALRERFADELLVEPLVMTEMMKTKKQIEDEQLANLDQRVTKQFLDTYKALPKRTVEPGCLGYEVLRAEHMEGRFDRERDAIEKTFLWRGRTQGSKILPAFRKEKRRISSE
jgi:DNA repair ATPase RecN